MVTRSGAARPPRARRLAQARNTHRVVFSNRTVITHGLRRMVLLDLYHYFMTVRWPTLFAAFAAFFFAFNLLFALGYWLSPGCIANLNPPGFWATSSSASRPSPRSATATCTRRRRTATCWAASRSSWE
jgi:hypothetical protein